MNIGDVLSIQTADSADISPHSEYIAIALPRPASDGEVYGRNAYEIDPSRTDIWLVRRDGGALRRLTNGEPDAAGYWCPHWSPDGKRLAMLSTDPQADEPHGGDNVRLYIWESETGEIKRVINQAVVTQTRYGSPFNRLDLRKANFLAPQTCREFQENSPYLWLDNNRILVLLMPRGERSAMVDRFAKYHRDAAIAGTKIRNGTQATVSQSASGSALSAMSTEYHAELAIIDLQENSYSILGKIPAFPRLGSLSLAVAPDSSAAVIMAPVRAIQPHLLSEDRPNIGAWAVQNALFVAELNSAGGVTRVSLPDTASLPFDLIGWSPDANWFALRARSGPGILDTRISVLNANTNMLRPILPDIPVGSYFPSHTSRPNFAHWAGATKLLIKTKDGSTTENWLLADVNTGGIEPISGNPANLLNLSSLEKPLIVGQGSRGLVSFNPASSSFEPWMNGGKLDCSYLGNLIFERSNSGIEASLITATGVAGVPISLPLAARIISYDCTGIVWGEERFNGSTVRFSNWSGSDGVQTLMRHNSHLGEIDWGERRMIDYTHADGSNVQMAIILPPDYDPEIRYPTLFWVYGGFSPRSTGNFFFDPQQPGIYNLQLYASRGYVVVLPSIPIRRDSGPIDPFGEIAGGVLPALDRLIDLGITDEDRVGVFGQSNGGYTTSALVAQSDRFAAAVTLAGATDLATVYGAFDPISIGWGSAAQDLDANEIIYEAGLGFKVDPATAPDYFHKNSPLTYASQINTPLLLIHGELDTRAPLSQPEALYSLLRRHGRTAKLLRYAGENHSLANSPANVRDMSREILEWFDTYLTPQDGEESSAPKTDANSKRGTVRANAPA